jgi:uncharacterized protein YndB with AHSA1/START domain
MPTRAESGVLVREVRIAARPETIFPFLVDPDKMVLWQGISARLDPRPGGTYYCNITGRDIASGEFVSVEPPHRVVYTFGWEGDGTLVPAGSSTVEITLTADGAGTILRLRHSGLPAEAQESHGEGWTHYLQRLADRGEGRDPGPDSWITEHPAATD